MKRFIILSVFAAFCLANLHAQGMSDAQVAAFIKREVQAGTSQSQIVTKLMQRGVNIEQIRRIRNEYDSQIKSHGVSAAADGAMSVVAERMKANSDGTTAQEVTSGRRGTTGQTYADAAEEHAEAERDVQSTQNVPGEAMGKRSSVGTSLTVRLFHSSQT